MLRYFIFTTFVVCFCLVLMKHVFLVHSHITYLVAKQVIVQQGISPADCIYFTTRSYSTPDGLEDIRFSSFLGYDDKPRAWAGMNVCKTQKNIRYCDALISQMIGDEFYFYTPQTMTDMANVIVTNSKCMGYFLIEEGIGSYLNREITLYRSWRKAAVYLLRLLFPRVFSIKRTFLHTNHPKFKGGFGLGESIFPLLKDRSKVFKINPPFERVQLENIPEAVIVLDNFYGLSIPTSTYFDVLEDTISYMVIYNHYSSVAYKYHPFHYTQPQLMSELERLMGELSKKYNLTIFQLDRNVVLENIAKSYPKVAFYAVQSSVLFYAKLMGCRTYTMARLVINRFPQFADYWNGVDKILSESGEAIENKNAKQWA